MLIITQTLYSLCITTTKARRKHKSTTESRTCASLGGFFMDAVDRSLERVGGGRGRVGDGVGHGLMNTLTPGPCSPLLAAESAARRVPPCLLEWLLLRTPSQHDRRLHPVARSSSQSPAAVGASLMSLTLAAPTGTYAVMTSACDHTLRQRHDGTAWHPQQQS